MKGLERSNSGPIRDLDESAYFYRKPFFIDGLEGQGHDHIIDQVTTLREELQGDGRGGCYSSRWIGFGREDRDLLFINKSFIVIQNGRRIGPDKIIALRHGIRDIDTSFYGSPYDGILLVSDDLSFIVDELDIEVIAEPTGLPVIVEIRLEPDGLACHIIILIILDIRSSLAETG